MNILFVAPFPPHKGGIAYYSAHFLKHAPPALSVRAYGFERVFPRFLYPGSAAPDARERLAGVTYPFTGYNPLSWRRAAALPPSGEEGILLLPWWTSAMEPALAGIRKSFLKTHPGWKTVLWCHNVREHEHSGWKERLARRMFDRADGFIVHSEAAAEELRSWRPDAPVCEAFLPLHPLPVPLPSKPEARGALGLEPDRIVFLFMGVVRPYKGTGPLLDAVEAFRDDPRVRWVVAGDFWRGTRNLVPRLESAGARVFPGYQPWERMAALLAAADLLILPYLHASGSGMLMTALAHGIPVLTSDVPHLRACLPPGNPIIPAGNGETLTAHLRSLAANPALLAPLAQGARAHAPNFTWGAWFARVGPFLERLGTT